MSLNETEMGTFCLYCMILLFYLINDDISIDFSYDLFSHFQKDVKTTSRARCNFLFFKFLEQFT